MLTSTSLAEMSEVFKEDPADTCPYCGDDLVTWVSIGFNSYTKNFEIKKFCESCRRYYTLELELKSVKVDEKQIEYLNKHNLFLNAKEG